MLTSTRRPRTRRTNTNRVSKVPILSIKKEKEENGDVTSIPAIATVARSPLTGPNENTPRASLDERDMRPVPPVVGDVGIRATTSRTDDREDEKTASPAVASSRKARSGSACRRRLARRLAGIFRESHSPRSSMMRAGGAGSPSHETPGYRGRLRPPDHRSCRSS